MTIWRSCSYEMHRRASASTGAPIAAEQRWPRRCCLRDLHGARCVIVNNTSAVRLKLRVDQRFDQHNNSSLL
jgi:hypothetical protein